MTNCLLKTQVEADFLSTIGCDAGAIGSYERGSLSLGLLILEGYREDANSCATGLENVYQNA